MKKIVSFSPTFEADVNIFQFEPLTQELINAILQAKAVIFPPSITSEVYFFVKNLNIPVFPEYTYRFMYPGKVGQTLLLKSLNLPHPKTIIIPRICGLEENPYERELKLSFPLVLKGNFGDEGSEVFLINNKEEFYQTLKLVKKWELSGKFGFLLQEYIENSFDARAVVIGDWIGVYFREGGFKKNIVQEGRLIPPPDKNLEEKVIELTKLIVKKTGFNLVAIDFLFKKDEPLVCEFNFTFGRRLVGEELYQTLLIKAIREFLKKV